MISQSKNGQRISTHSRSHDADLSVQRRIASRHYTSSGLSRTAGLFRYQRGMKLWFRECSTELSTRYCFLRSSTNCCLMMRASRRRNLFLLPCICSAQGSGDARCSKSIDDLRGLVGHQILSNACVRLRIIALHAVSTSTAAMTTMTVV